MNTFLFDEAKRNPYSLKSWIRLLDNVSDISQKSFVYDEALMFLPRSYKLWRYYLLALSSDLPADLIPKSDKLTHLIELYERALHCLNKMPRLW